MKESFLQGKAEGEDSLSPQTLVSEGSEIMEKERYIYWKDEDMWIGYLEKYPDYMTQGETIEELKENLKDIYEELIRGGIPCVRELAELEIA